MGSLADLFDRCIDETEAAQKALSYVVHLMGNYQSMGPPLIAMPMCFSHVML